MVDFIVKAAEFTVGGMFLAAVASLVYNLKQVSTIVQSQMPNRHYLVTVSDYAGHRVEREADSISAVAVIAADAARELQTGATPVED